MVTSVSCAPRAPTACLAPSPSKLPSFQALFACLLFPLQPTKPWKRSPPVPLPTKSTSPLLQRPSPPPLPLPRRPPPPQRSRDFVVFTQIRNTRCQLTGPSTPLPTTGPHRAPAPANRPLMKPTTAGRPWRIQPSFDCLSRAKSSHRMLQGPGCHEGRDVGRRNRRADQRLSSVYKVWRGGLFG